MKEALTRGGTKRKLGDMAFIGRNQENLCLVGLMSRVEREERIRDDS